MRSKRYAVKTRLSAVIVVTLLLTIPAQSSAQQVVLPVPNVTQNTPQWCWVAVAEMVIRYLHLGAGFNQCAMLQDTYRAPCCVQPAMCNRPGHMAEIQNLIARYGGRWSSMAPALDPNSIALHLSQNRPIIAFVRLPMQDVGHFVVIRGIRNTPLGPQVLINDPLSWVPSTVSLAQFYQYWQASIVVWA